jgi:hypothetical protein
MGVLVTSRRRGRVDVRVGRGRRVIRQLRKPLEMGLILATHVFLCSRWA